MQHTITDDLSLLLATLPPHIAQRIESLPQQAELIEIVMDLGRIPEARFPNGEVILNDAVINDDDLAYVTERVGTFGDDNRAGIERTLHRISAIRNRRGKVIGLTCRVGRAVTGTISLVSDVIEEGRSLLILGRPGVGKTTMLREIARVLADDFGKRVVIVDTSNEIAGDGDVPHPGIGRARRMQVARPAEQHAVMIEAVENHMPEVIIIDEIGTELEAQAARTIAERGVQLVGTAHGNTLDNLLLNPTLSDLIGGISSVTLGDEEARRRGTQKTVLERKAPPTFDVVVEQQDRTRILIHSSVADAVDALLRGDSPSGAVRSLENGKLRSEIVSITSQRPELSAHIQGDFGFSGGGENRRGRGRQGYETLPRVNKHITSLSADLPPVVPPGRLIPMPQMSQPYADERDTETQVPLVQPHHDDGILRIFASGLEHERITEIAKEFGKAVHVTSIESEADVIMMHRSRYLRRNDDPSHHNIPLLVLASRNRSNIRKALSQTFGLPITVDDDEEEMAQVPLREPLAKIQPTKRGNGSSTATRAQGPDTVKALQEVEDAINYVLHGHGKGVELTPQRATIRRLQHMLAERYNVTSRSQGKEPNRRVCIFSAS